MEIGLESDTQVGLDNISFNIKTTYTYKFVPTTTYLGIIYAYIQPAKVDLVILRLEPTAQSLVGWSSAPALLHRDSAPSFRFQPLRGGDLSVIVSCLNCVCACVHQWIYLVYFGQ